MENEYDFLRKGALHHAKLGREAISSAEKRFYEAIRELAAILYQNRIHHLEIENALDKLTDYPKTLRAVLDAEDTANAMLQRAESIRRGEYYAAKLGKETQEAK